MLKPIKSKKQLEDYLSRAYELMQLDLLPDSKQSDELEVLSILIEEYEKKYFPIAPPHPLEAILFRLDQMGMEKSELSNILGNRSRVSEIFSGKRKLNLKMIRALNKTLKIPTDILIQEYDLETV